MDPADRARCVNAGGIAAESLDDMRRPDERGPTDEGETTGPAGESGDNVELAILADTEGSIAAVIDPEPAIVEARAVWSGESANDRLTGRPRKDDSTPVDWE